MARTAVIERNTKETQIRLSLNLDGERCRCPPASASSTICSPPSVLCRHRIEGGGEGGIYMWTATTPWRTPALCWAKP